MIVLGIDPGVATIGFGVIRAERQKNTLLRYGVITTPPGIPLSRRLLQISDDMEELIHAFHPDEMAVEELFFTKNITTGIAVAHGRGVILLAAEKLGVPIFEYTPMQVKQAVAGYGGADKRQVMLMTQRLLSMREVPRPDDAADALATDQETKFLGSDLPNQMPPDQCDQHHQRPHQKCGINIPQIHVQSLYGTGRTHGTRHQIRGQIPPSGSPIQHKGIV